MTEGTPKMKRLRLVRSLETNPWANLALEEHLVDLCPEDEAALYLWQNTHTVVIGRNQNAWSECRLELLEKEGGRLARRSTGGGAVYHDLGNLNFSFIMPRTLYNMNRQLGVILGALAELGIEAEFSGRNDLLARGRKFSGNAYQLKRHCGLHHGTLLVSVDMERLSRYLQVDPEKLRSKGVRSVESRVINLGEIAPGLDMEALRLALEKRFLEEYPHEDVARESGFPANEAFEATRRRYSDPEWIYGKSPPCGVTVRRRFEWGLADLRFDVISGRVCNTVLYSDAMDGERICAIATALDGLPFRWEVLAEAVRGVAPRSAEAADVARWLENALHPEPREQ